MRISSPAVLRLRQLQLCGREVTPAAAVVDGPDDAVGEVFLGDMNIPEIIDLVSG